MIILINDEDDHDAGEDDDRLIFHPAASLEWVEEHDDDNDADDIDHPLQSF